MTEAYEQVLYGMFLQVVLADLDTQSKIMSKIFKCVEVISPEDRAMFLVVGFFKLGYSQYVIDLDKKNQTTLKKLAVAITGSKDTTIHEHLGDFINMSHAFFASRILKSNEFKAGTLGYELRALRPVDVSKILSRSVATGIWKQGLIDWLRCYDDGAYHGVHQHILDTLGFDSLDELIDATFDKPESKTESKKRKSESPAKPRPKKKSKTSKPNITEVQPTKRILDFDEESNDAPNVNNEAVDQEFDLSSIASPINRQVVPQFESPEFTKPASHTPFSKKMFDLEKAEVDGKLGVNDSVVDPKMDAFLNN